jgi:hypothetical protein
VAKLGIHALANPPEPCDREALAQSLVRRDLYRQIAVTQDVQRVAPVESIRGEY